jgi:hypothetical protein
MSTSRRPNLPGRVVTRKRPRLNPVELAMKRAKDGHQYGLHEVADVPPSVLDIEGWLMCYPNLRFRIHMNGPMAKVWFQIPEDDPCTTIRDADAGFMVIDNGEEEDVALAFHSVWPSGEMEVTECMFFTSLSFVRWRGPQA